MKWSKILIVIVGTIAALLALILIIALFLPQEYSAEKEIIINRSKIEVFNYVKYLKNQDYYSVWANMDPKMKKSYLGIDAQPGFVSRWESNNEKVGVGEQEIIKITEGERIDYELRFFEPFEAKEPAYMITETVSDNQTKVKWGFMGKFAYPTNFMFIFMDMEQMIGNDLEKGLKTLKGILESEK